MGKEESLRRFVLCAWRMHAHSDVPGWDKLLRHAPGSIDGHLNLAVRMTITRPLPADEGAFESLASRVRPLAAKSEPVHHAKIFGAIEGLVGVVASDAPPMYERKEVPTSFTPFAPAVRQVREQTPDMPATAVAERVGWTGSMTWFSDDLRRLRTGPRSVDPYDRLIWLSGDAAQGDATCGSRRRRSRSRTTARCCSPSWWLPPRTRGSWSVGGSLPATPRTSSRRCGNSSRR